MGLIICSKHGQSGFAIRISKKVCDSIRANTLTSDSQLRLFTIELLVDEDTAVKVQYLLEVNEAKNIGLPVFARITTEAENDAYFSRMPEMSGVCGNCLEEYKIKYGLSLLKFK